jgi:hypothetical protein
VAAIKCRQEAMLLLLLLLLLLTVLLTLLLLQLLLLLLLLTVLLTLLLLQLLLLLLLLTVLLTLLLLQLLLRRRRWRHLLLHLRPLRATLSAPILSMRARSSSLDGSYALCGRHDVESRAHRR